MFVESGFLKISAADDVVFDYLRPGDICGERCLEENRTGQVARALTDVAVLSIPGARSAAAVCGDRELAARVLNSLVRRMAHYEEAIADFVSEPTERRIAKFFLRFQDRGGQHGWTEIPNLTNPEIASTVGTTRWQVSRYINRLRQLRIVRRDRGLWIDFDLLKAFLSREQRAN